VSGTDLPFSDLHATVTALIIIALIVIGFVIALKCRSRKYA